MASTITIGRFGLDPEIPTGIGAAQWEVNGDEITVSGQNWMFDDPLVGAALRLQLIGLAVNHDEDYVPVTSTDDTANNGYYRVLETEVSSEDLLVSDGHFSWSATLRRPPSGFSYPVVEIRALSADRVGKPVGMVGEPWLAVPETWQGFDYGAAATVTPEYRKLLGGTVDMAVYTADNTTPPSVFADALISVGAAPADFYTGAPKLTVNGYPVIGRQIPNVVTDWTIENDLVRVSSSSGASNHFTVEWVDSAGAGWETAWGYQLGYGYAVFTALGGGVTPRSITAKRVGPEEVKIRLAYQSYSAQSGSVTMDLSVRRGSRYVVCSVRAAETREWGIVPQTTFTAAAIDPLALGWTTGYRETTTNADGQRRCTFSGSADAVVFAGTGGAILDTAGTDIDVCVACDVTPAAGVGPDRGVDLHGEYFMVLVEHQRVRAQ